MVQCLSQSVGEVEGTGATGTQGQVARNRSPLKQTAFCNYVLEPSGSVDPFGLEMSGGWSF